MAISVSKPTVGGSEDAWGTLINTALDTIVDGVNGTSGTIAPDLTTLTINGVDVTSTAAELNYVDGVTSAIQTQLDAKAPTESPTFTGTATVPTANVTTANVTTVDLGDWTITQSGSDLKFAYQGTDRLKLSSAGALTVENDITAFGSA
jgi:hypothetical protein